MLVLGNTVLIGLADGDVRISSCSAAVGISRPFDIVRGTCAPVVAIVPVGATTAELTNAVCVLAADGAVRHYAFDGCALLA
mmetsp:Transcript_3358/g.8793  ORF Transcript_3358/g.8793 Transcript_3358/m.8793 type:complete len:81 (+) Transcript_3358:151-393(+)